jgi:hypothetical protein
MITVGLVYDDKNMANKLLEESQSDNKNTKTVLQKQQAFYTYSNCVESSSEYKMRQFTLNNFCTSGGREGITGRRAHIHKPRHCRCQRQLRPISCYLTSHTASCWGYDTAVSPNKTLHHRSSIKSLQHANENIRWQCNTRKTCV